MLNTKKVEDFRVITGALASDASYGVNGVFKLKHNGKLFRVIISDTLNWEHVSISAAKMPSWNDMCHFKSLFFEPEDIVIQYHPAEKEYINCHPTCLHLWRPIGFIVPTPPTILIGQK